MAFQLALGCSSGAHRTCCNAPCATCAELFARYGYTTLQLSGSSGPVYLFSGTPPGTAATWAGFTDGTLTIPSSQGGFCDDSIIREVGMAVSQNYYFASTDPVQFFAGPFVKAQIVASIFYECSVDNIPIRGIGIGVGYEVSGDVSAQFSESSFPDWTWTTLGIGGRKATKTFANGSVAEWTRQPAFGGRTSITGRISHIEFNLNAGNPVITTLTLPAFPYDYLGIMVGTVTIS